MMHADDKPFTSWKSGHVNVTLPEGFGASPVTQEESAKWLEMCRQQVPALMAQARRDAPEFEFVHRKSDVEVWKGKMEGSPLHLIKGSCIVPCSFEEMLVSMTCPTTENFNRNMRIVDENFLCARALHTFAGAGALQDEFGNVITAPQLPYANLRWSCFNAPWPVWNRDFVFVQYLDRVEMGGEIFAVVVSFSVERPDCPPLNESHKFVRGRILETGYVARLLPGGMMELTYVVQADLAGIVPVWLQNLLAPVQGYNVARSRTMFGARRAAEAAFSTRGGCKSPHFTQFDTVAHFFTVNDTDTLSIPIAPRTESGQTLHYAILPVDVPHGLTLNITTGGDEEQQPVDGCTTAISTGELFEGAFPLAAGVQYRVLISHAGKGHGNVAIKMFVHPHGLEAGGAPPLMMGAPMEEVMPTRK